MEANWKAKQSGERVFWVLMETLYPYRPLSPTYTHTHSSCLEVWGWACLDRCLVMGGQVTGFQATKSPALCLVMVAMRGDALILIDSQEAKARRGSKTM